MLQSILVFSTFLGLFYDPLQLYHTWNMQRKSNTECPLCKRSSFALLSFISFELLCTHKVESNKSFKRQLFILISWKYLEILKSKPVSSQSWGNLNNWHSKLRRTKEASAQLCKSFFCGTNIMPDSYQNWWWSSISWGLLQREKILRELLQHILARLISLLRKRWKW